MPRFDMHCHTKVGSIDSKISIEEYISILKSKGFDGMLVTDHDSYKGYRYYLSNVPKDPNFTVLKGVEYDTKDAGHFIVIMPQDVTLKVLQIRGLALEELISVVHANGGILGPAHPFGARSSSALFCNKVRKDWSILKKCDFFEGFNSCETPIANTIAQTLAEKCGKQCFGGSDSHKEDYVGLAYTDFAFEIKDNDDLIAAVRQQAISDFGGQERTFLKKHRKRNSVFATYGFKAYNRALGFLFCSLRNSYMRSGI